MALRKIKNRYYIAYRDECSRHRMLALGTADLEEAKKLHDEMKAQISAGKVARKMLLRHHGIITPEAAQQTLAAHPLPEYRPRQRKRLKLKEMIEVASKVRKLSDRHITCFETFRKSVKLEYADEVTPEIAQWYLDENYGESKSKTFNNHLTMLNVVFRCCLVQARLKESPFSSIMRRVNSDTEHYRPFTTEEFIRIFNVAAEPWKTAALISWYTGLRRESCFKLSWSHIDCDDQSITIMPGKTARYGRAVYIPIHEELWDWLCNLPRPEDDTTPILSQWGMYIHFPGHKNQTYFAGMLDALDIRSTPEGKASFHGIRDSFITRCDEAGIVRHAIRGVAGQTDDRITDLYSHDKVSARQILRLPSLGVVGNFVGNKKE